MPRGDGTGPMGMGAMTGRGAGYCAGAVQAGYGTAGFGRGLGRRFGAAWGGFGFRRGGGLPGRMAPLSAAVTPDVEKQWLNNQALTLQAELEQVQKRLAAMNASAPEKSGTGQ